MSIQRAQTIQQMEPETEEALKSSIHHKITINVNFEG